MISNYQDARRYRCTAHELPLGGWLVKLRVKGAHEPPYGGWLAGVDQRAEAEVKGIPGTYSPTNGYHVTRYN